MIKPALFLISMFLYCCNAIAAERQPIEFACLSGPSMPDYQYLERAIKPVIESLGYRLLIHQYAGDLAVEKIRRKVVDGDCGRAGMFRERFDLDLIQVRPAFRTASISVWGPKKYTSAAQKHPETLRLGYLSGPYFEKVVKDLGFKPYKAFESVAALLAAFDDQSVDIILTYDATLLTTGNGHASQNKAIKLKQIAAIPVYLYLQPARRFLEEPLSRAIRQTKKATPYSVRIDQALPVGGEKEIIFGCSIAKSSEVFPVIEGFYRQLFHKLGFDFKMIALPRAREIAELNRGALDGSCGRENIEPFISSKNLQMIDVPIAEVTFDVLALSAQGKIKSLSQLPPDSTVAYVRGSEKLKKVLQTTSHLKLIRVTTPDIGMKMLAAKRIDYFVGANATYTDVIERSDFNVPFYTVFSLAKMTMYPYVHVQHKGLVSDMELEMRRFLVENQRRFLFEY